MRCIYVTSSILQSGVSVSCEACLCLRCALVFSTRRIETGENTAKTQIQTIVHLPIPNESKSGDFLPLSHFYFSRTRNEQDRNGVRNSWCASETKCSVYLLFDALVGDQQFYDYSLRIFLPFLILLFLGKIWECCNKNTLMLPMLSYGPCSLCSVFTSAFACVRTYVCLCVWSARNQHMSIANDNGRTRWLTSDRKRFFFLVSSAHFVRMPHSMQSIHNTANVTQSFIQKFSITEPSFELKWMKKTHNDNTNNNRKTNSSQT